MILHGFPSLSVDIVEIDLMKTIDRLFIIHGDITNGKTVVGAMLFLIGPRVSVLFV